MTLFFKQTILLKLFIGAFLAMVLFAPLQTALAQSTQTPPTCGFTNITGCMASVANGMLSAAGFVTWLGGVGLNQAVKTTVLEMHQINQWSSLQRAWEVLRDLANIAIIFVLLTIGIATILQISQYGMRELLLRLLIVALLINFSFFITKAVVQVGNSFAIVAYNQLVGQQCPQTSSGQAASCISDKFMTAMRLPTVYNLQSASASPLYQTTGSLTVGKIMIVGIFGSIVLVIAGFVFAAGAILLIIRFVLLVLLMIVAPVAWIAYVLPTTRGIAEKWWGVLWRETFFAPAYIILLVAALWIAQTANFMGNAQVSYADAMLAGNASSAALFVHFAIIIGFLIAALIISRQIGAYGSTKMIGVGQKWAKNIGSYARQGAGNATFGLAGAVGRNALGRLSSTLAKREGVQNLAAQGGWKGTYGRSQLKALRGAATSSFDARTLPGLKDASDLVGKAGGKGGYEKKLKGQISEQKKFAKSLGKERGSIYADNLEKRRAMELLWTKVPRKHKESAAAIRKELSKSEKDKDKEDLIEAVKGAVSEKGED